MDFDSHQISQDIGYIKARLKELNGLYGQVESIDARLDAIEQKLAGWQGRVVGAAAAIGAIASGFIWFVQWIIKIV